MKVAKLIRKSAIVIGMGAALVLAACTKAQEITNTDWPNPNTVAFNKQAAATAGELNSAASALGANGAARAVAARSAAVQSKISGEAGFVLGALSVGTAVAMYLLANQKMRKPRKS